MKIDSAEAERIRQHFLGTSPSDQPRSDCPDPELLWAGVKDRLSPRELSPLLEHVAGCPVCTQAWSLGRELEPPAVAKPAAQPVPWLKIAAGLLLVVAAGIIWSLLDQQPAPSVFRTPAQEALVLKTESCPKHTCRLEWSGIEGALYNVTVTDSQLTILSQAKGLTQPLYQIPSEDLAEAVSGSQLRVAVVARRPGEGVVAEQSSRLSLQ